MTVFDGTAKPMPSFPPESLSICELMPMTWPSRSRSGPPELPWLIAASVWIASLMAKLFGEVIVPVQGAHDSARDGLVEPERAADGDDLVADLDRARVAELKRRELRARGVDLDDGDVGGGIRADELCVVCRAVREFDRDRACAGDDMVVRDDVASAVDHEAGAESLALLACSP